MGLPFPTRFLEPEEGGRLGSFWAEPENGHGGGGIAEPSEDWAICLAYAFVSRVAVETGCGDESRHEEELFPRTLSKESFHIQTGRR